MAKSVPVQNTGGGTTVSFTNTPQAKDDDVSSLTTGLTEDSSTAVYLDVMANDLGGNAKSLWAVDNGVNNFGAMSGYAAGDLLTEDAGRTESASADSSLHGAKIWITADGKIGYDPSTMDAGFATQLQALAVGEELTDSFIYAIRLGNGTLSWAGATVHLAGVNDIVSITSAPQSGAVVEDANTTPSTTDSLNAAGTIGFSDVDLSDTHTASFAAAAGNTTALGTFAIGPVNEAPNAANGTVGWTYELNNNAAQYLAAGQSVTETYTVTVNDGHGSTATQNVTITITGTNDAPVVTSGPQAGAVTEDAATPTLSDTGTIAFNDVDLIDAHTASVAADAGNTLGGTLTMGAVSESATTEPGTVGWTYSVANSAVQYLAAGQTATEKFKVTISDGQGGTVDQTVVATVTGTNDGPTITAGLTDAAGAVTEDASAPTLSDTGTIAFNDVDLIDAHTASVAADAGNTLGGTLTLGAVSESATTEPGSVGWTYNVANSAVQYLAAGQTATEKFKVTISDGQGGTVDQTVVATVTGTNDVPVIGAAQLTGAMTEQVAPNGNLTSSGSIAFGDVDLTDTHGVTASAVGTTLGTLTAAVSTDTTGSGAGGQVTWNYSVADSAVEYLAAGQTKTESFTVTLDDHNGGVVQRQVDVTITGTNDAPVIASGPQAGGMTEDGSSTATGAVTFKDVDLIDTHAATVTPAASNTTSLGTLALAPIVDSTGGATGTQGWSYTLDNAKADYLAQGQTVIENYTVAVKDNSGATATQNVAITITGANDAPVVTSGPQAGGVTEDGSSTATGAVAFKDVDLIDTHTATVTPAASNTTSLGTLALAPVADSTGGATGAQGWTYTLDNTKADYLAEGQKVTENYTVTVKDNNGATATQNVAITITGANDAPVANNDSNALTVTPLASQVHSNVVNWVNWTSNTITGYDGPDSVGTVTGTIDLGNGNTIGVTYTGEYLFAQTNGGTDYYNNPTDVYGHPISATGTYTSAAVANAPPNSDMIALNLANQTRTLTFSKPVDNLYFAVVSLNNNGYIFDQDFQVASYGPGYWGNGTLARQPIGNGAYEVVGTGEPHGVLSIDGTVQKLTWTSAGNEAWNGFTVGTYGLAQTATATGNVRANDSDPDSGDTFALTAVNGQPMTGNSLSLTLLSGAKINVNKDGTYLYDENSAFASLAQGQTTQDHFQYTITDSHGASSTATVTINVTGVNDAPVITSSAQNASGAVQAEHTSTTLSGTLTVDNGYTVYISSDDSQLGTYLGSGNDWTKAFVMNQAQLTQGSTNYLHVVATNAGGPGGFLGSFTLSDSNFAFTNGSTAENTTAADWKLSLTGFGSNYQTPVNEGLNGVGPWGLRTEISSSSNWMWNYESHNQSDYNTEYFSMKISPVLPHVGGQLTASDVDQGATQAWSVVGGGVGTYGALAVDANTGAWAYSLNNNSSAVTSLAAGVSANDNFTVRVTDDHGATADQIVSVKVTGINDAPAAVNDSASTNEDTPVSINVLGNDTDPDVGDTKTLVSATGAQHGTLALSGGNVVYTPSANYNGADSFNYTMKDAAGVTSSATVGVTVKPVTDNYVLSNIVTNGSFELGVAPGWTTIGDGVDRVASSGWQSGDGSYSLDLNAFHPGGVQQVLATTPGVQYTVGFDLSKNPGGHADHATVHVSAASNSSDYTFSAANSASNMMWSQQSFTFTATGTSTTLSFASTYPNDSVTGQPWEFYAEGPALDEVVVVTNQVINNFTKGRGGDVLQLNGLLSSIGAPHDSTAFTGGFLNFAQSGGNTMVQVDANGGGDHYMTVATVVGVSLSQADTGSYAL